MLIRKNCFKLTAERSLNFIQSHVCRKTRPNYCDLKIFNMTAVRHFDFLGEQVIFHRPTTGSLLLTLRIVCSGKIWLKYLDPFPIYWGNGFKMAAGHHLEFCRKSFFMPKVYPESQ